jgi:hypothetical protein
MQGVSVWAQKDLNLRPTDYESALNRIHFVPNF